MNNRILILTNSGDLHADLMVSLLTKKGARPFRLNLDRFPKDFEISQQLTEHGHNATISHLPTNDSLNIDDIKSVWTRKTSDFNFLSDDLHPQEHAHAVQETEHLLNGLLYSLDCYWINHPTAIRSAQYKGEQALRAVKMGFKVPQSLITNKPIEVQHFRRAISGEMITKSMSSPYLSAETVDAENRIVGGLTTTIITDEHLQNLEAVKEIPCYFQAYTDKQFELRVTVIGNQVFAAKIHSQQCESTKVDFRDFSAEIDYEAYSLPKEIEQRCLDFVHSYQLQYGALDIIVTPEQDYVFLENNPAGQFWFVQQLVPQLTMLEALADRLMEGATCQH